jgi:hypothetical protein
MAGTINIALTQQFDMDGRVLSGGLLYTFVAGTTTPQNAFQDTALTIAHPNPIVLDASGRVPMFYVADGFIKVRLTTKGGVTIFAQDQLLVVGPSTGGGGGGGGSDPTTLLATGDIKARFGLGPLDGYVQCNGNTIGSAVSGATERANADCQALFEYLWSTGAVGIFAGVTPARGSSANADWLANKRCATPDLRGRAIFGLDDMGAAAAGRLTPVLWGSLSDGSPFDVGSASGQEFQILTFDQLAPHDHPVSISDPSHVHNDGLIDLSHTHTIIGTTDAESAGHTHNFGGVTGVENQAHDHSFTSGVGTTGATFGGVPVATSPGGSVTNTENQNHNHSFSGVTGDINQGHTHTFVAVSLGNNETPMQIVNQAAFTGIDVAVGATGNGNPIVIVNPSMVMTFYIKL